MDERLYTATAYEIETDYYLYHLMVDIMTKIDGTAPIGCCCGRNKAQHCATFIKNKTKYLQTMAEIENRTIVPKMKGQLVQVTTEQKFYNIDTCSDKEIMHLIEIGAVSNDDFDMRNYKGEEKKVEQTAQKQPKKDKKKR
jgi:hypothetical protein